MNKYQNSNSMLKAALSDKKYICIYYKLYKRSWRKYKSINPFWSLLNKLVFLCSNIKICWSIIEKEFLGERDVSDRDTFSTIVTKMQVILDLWSLVLSYACCWKFLLQTMTKFLNNNYNINNIFNTSTFLYLQQCSCEKRDVTNLKQIRKLYHFHLWNL